MAVACLYLPDGTRWDFLRNMESIRHKDLSWAPCPDPVIVAGYG